ncbi:CaiB/BaiF CoA transferase family protein [Phytoactinopolyspora limicola]|uniref:CaiB/BaiF CoA transferase family protein n=1 Tax=Phytoactinopolyspora limicola TaxID=2715536 RepID=UPI00140BC17E|nr:CaiB/BaiF CoA-transferase family protein [Phytoactinopolyspora limicola]
MGNSAQGNGPLAGLRVLEIEALGPVPFGGMLLADLGADVVKVMRPGEPGGPRPHLPADLPTQGQQILDRGKRTLTVDLKDNDGRALVRTLASHADVLLEGFRPGVAERLGIGPDICLQAHPSLVYGRMTGWGQSGPLAGTAGHDITYLAASGVLGALGRQGCPPPVPLNLLGDFGGGALYLVIGVLAARQHVLRGGPGQVVDAAVVDGVTHLSTMIFGMYAAGEWRAEPGTNLLDSGCPFYDVYETSDRRHMAVGALEPKFYWEFVRLLGVAHAVPRHRDPSVWDEMRRVFTNAFRRRSQREWAAIFAGTDACVSPVATLPEVTTSSRAATRDTVISVDDVPQPAPAPRFSGTPCAVPRSATPLGSWAAQLIAEWVEET